MSILGRWGCFLWKMRGWGWGWRAFREEANRGEGLKVPDSWPFRFYIGVVLPIVIAALLVIGLVDKFHLLDKLR